MKKLLLLSSVLCMVSSVSFAMEVKPYFEARISENFMKSDLKDLDFSQNFKFHDHFIQGGSLELGVKLDQFRVGVEGYYNDKMEDAMEGVLPVALKSKGVFLNAYYDISLCENLKKIKPFVGAGIGYSWLSETAKLSVATGGWLPDSTLKDKDVSWNVGLGVAYELNPNVDLTVGYRYENLGEIKGEIISGNTENEITNHKASVGLRYTF